MSFQLPNASNSASSQPVQGSGQNVEISQVFKNTSQEIIETTTDKLKLILIEYLARIEDNKAWQMPLSLLITILLVFCTADFKEAFKLKADFWKAIFLIGAVASAVWFMACLMNRSKSISIDGVIEKIKNNSDND